MQNKKVLMLVDDELQLDRRVLHEAVSLANHGYNVKIISLLQGMCRPKDLPLGVEIDDAALININSPGPRQDGAFKTILKKVLPRRLQQDLIHRFLDPGHRLVRMFGECDFGQWDILIAHNLPVLPLAFALQRKQGYGKVILDAHELYDEQYDWLLSRQARRYWRGIEDQYVSACAGVMTVTPRIALEIQKRHDLPEAPTVLLNACPLIREFADRGALHRLYGILPERSIILCQGNLAPGRSLEEFIKAWGYLTRPRPALVFLGFGHTDFICSLGAMVQRHGLGDDIFLGKAVPPDEVLRHTCGASLGLISNRGAGINNTDGGPNRLFEYIQARVPILSYEHNGVRQILEQTGTGWVVRWESPKHLAEVISEKLVEASEIPREQLDAAARKFCWENEEPKLLDLVSRLESDQTTCAEL